MCCIFRSEFQFISLPLDGVVALGATNKWVVVVGQHDLRTIACAGVKVEICLHRNLHVLYLN